MVVNHGSSRTVVAGRVVVNNRQASQKAHKNGPRKETTVKLQFYVYVRTCNLIFSRCFYSCLLPLMKAH